MAKKKPEDKSPKAEAIKPVQESPIEAVTESGEVVPIAVTEDAEVVELTGEPESPGDVVVTDPLTVNKIIAQTLETAIGLHLSEENIVVNVSPNIAAPQRSPEDWAKELYAFASDADPAAFPAWERLKPTTQRNYIAAAEHVLNGGQPRTDFERNLDWNVKVLPLEIEYNSN